MFWCRLFDVKILIATHHCDAMLYQWFYYQCSYSGAYIHRLQNTENKRGCLKFSTVYTVVLQPPVQITWQSHHLNKTCVSQGITNRTTNQLWTELQLVSLTWVVGAMLQVTNIACAHFGSTNLNVRNVEDGNNSQYVDRTNCGRLRSRSLYGFEETKHSVGETDKDRSYIRPRSRSFYVSDTDDAGTGNFSRCNSMRPRARSLHNEDGKRNTGGTSITAKPPIKRPKGNSSKRASKELIGVWVRSFYHLKMSPLSSIGQ